MAAAVALGVEAIQIGTRFVACAESPVHTHYKQAIVDAQATVPLMLNTKSTPCIRALKTDFSRALHEAGVMGPETFQDIQDVYFGGNINAAPALAGQSAGLIHEVHSASQIVQVTVAQFHAITARLGAMAAGANFS